MRIQQVLLSPRIGGAESLAAALSAAWDSLSVENEIHYLDPEGFGPRSRIRRIQRMRRSVKDFHPDVIVAHTALPNIYARIGSKKSIPKVIVLHSSAHDYDTRSLRVAERALRSRTQYVVGVGPMQVKEYAQHFGSRIPTSVIQNGVRGDLPREHVVTDGISIVTLARIATVKNPKLWQEVAARLRSLTDAKFVWWGPTADDASRQLVSTHQTAGKPGRFAGPTTTPGDVLREASILFHPSDRESNGLSIVEAACVGIPVVCSDTVASVLPPELEVTTFIAGDADGAAAALSRVLQNYHSHSSRARQQSSLARELFGIERCAQLYLAACRTAISAKA